MNPKRAASAWLLLGLLILPFCLNADPVETLIEEKKTEAQTWAEEEELPPVFVLGDASGAQIYDDAFSSYPSPFLCDSVELDRLAELAGFEPNEHFKILNTSLSSVQRLLEQGCVLRPQDVLLAVGPGWQKNVYVKGFAMKRDRAVCPHDSPFSLWASYTDSLAEDPLFLTTELGLKEGLNEFRSIKPLAENDVNKDLLFQLKKTVSFFYDYRVASYRLSMENCERVLILTRDNPGPDDALLPNEMMLFQKGDALETLLLERVDLKKGSGWIRDVSLLNFNNDAWIDLFVTATRHKCPYTVLFRGTKEGFERILLPTKPCEC